MITFGQIDPTKAYWCRHVAHALIMCDNKFLVVENTDGQLFLVGGGIENGETPIQAIHREAP